MHTLNLRLAPDEIGWIAARCRGSLPRRRRHPAAALSPVRRASTRSSKVIVFPFRGAEVPRRLSSTTRRCSPPHDGEGFDYAPHDENDPIAHVLHVGHDRPAEGRRLLASLDRAAHAGRAASATTGACAAPTRVLPVTPMFHANCWGVPYGAVMLGIAARLPGPAPAPRRPARPDRSSSRRRSRSACRPSGWA